MDAQTSQPRRSALHDLLLFGALAGALTLLFALTPLDLAVARLFYRPASEDPWPLAGNEPWAALYHLAPAITASLVLLGLAMLAGGVALRRASWRRHGALVLLTLMLGPGLLINGVFKDHWERPRPRDVVELGGSSPYVIAPLPGPGGASFPCGHCAVGFVYAAGWWIWRRRAPGWALASAIAGALAGLALGIGRMAAGGHFLSDVLWSALLALGMVHALYHYVLRIPLAEKAGTATALTTPEPVAAPGPAGAAIRERALLGLAVLGGLGVLLTLLVAPHGTALESQLPYATLRPAPAVFEVTASTADVIITLVDAGGEVAVRGELHGFGVPWGVLRAQSSFDARPPGTLRYAIEQRGAFTDLNGFVSIRLPIGALRVLRVRVQRGNIRLADLTRTRVMAHGQLRLEARTAHGRVQLK